MRVLRNNDTIRVTCTGCKSVLAVECDDVKTSDIGHGHASEFWARCAVCGKEICLSREQIPTRWISAILANNGIED